MDNQSYQNSMNQYQPTLTQLKAFVAVARHQHFSSAANELGVSQPTLSQALSSLEQGLGVQLIERSTRRVIITEAGHTLLPQAENVLDAANLFVSSAAGVSSGSFVGQLRMGIIPTVAPYILPGLLPLLAAKKSSIALTVVEDQTNRLFKALKVGSIDVAIMALDAGHPVNNIVEIPLFTEPFVLITPNSHSLAGRTDIKLEELNNADILLLDEGHCLRDQALDICRTANIERLPHIGNTRAASLATIVQCVAGGLGVSFIPEMAIPVEARRSDISCSRFVDPQPGRTIGLVYRASSVRAEMYNYLGKLTRKVAKDIIIPLESVI